MAEELTITETPTTDEKPITTDEPPVKIDENPVTTEEKPLPADVVALEPTPKRKPGRPPGSKNKEPGKPRKPRAKAVVVAEAVAPPEPPEPEPYDTPALPGSRRIPTEARDSHEAMMLRLLSHQAKARQQNKVALWKSWFH